MILNFTSKITKGPLKGWETEFVEKIKAGRKIHTIREDSKDRWKVGNKIHFCTGGYTPGRIFHEATCTNVIPFEIIWNHYETHSTFAINVGNNHWIGRIRGEGYSFEKWLKGEYFELSHSYPVKDLAANDGFDSVSDFLRYFNKNLSGKVIHWT